MTFLGSMCAKGLRVDRDGYPFDPDRTCDQECGRCQRQICTMDVDEEEDPTIRPYEPIDEEDENDDELELFYGYSEEEL